MHWQKDLCSECRKCRGLHLFVVVDWFVCSYFRALFLAPPPQKNVKKPPKVVLLQLFICSKVFVKA